MPSTGAGELTRAAVPHHARGTRENLPLPRERDGAIVQLDDKWPHLQMSLGKLTLLSADCLGSGARVGSSRMVADSSGTCGVPGGEDLVGPFLGVDGEGARLSAAEGVGAVPAVGAMLARGNLPAPSEGAAGSSLERSAGGATACACARRAGSSAARVVFRITALAQSARMVVRMIVGRNCGIAHLVVLVVPMGTR